MWQDIKRAFKFSLRHLTHPPATFLMFVTGYAALILTLYLFLTTREATWWQVLLTLIFALFVPYLFAMLQTMGVRVSHQVMGAATDDTANNAGRVSVGEQLRGGVRGAWKILLASVPVILIALLGVYLLNRLDARLTRDVIETIDYSARANTATSDAVGWRDALVTTFRVLVLGAVVPLIAVHLWSAIVNFGWRVSVRRTGSILASAFMPAALLTYTLGAILFIGAPYILVSTRTPVSSAWFELTLLGVRLIFAFLFFVFGWTLTQGALSRLMMNRVGVDSSPEISADTKPHEAAPRVKVEG